VIRILNDDPNHYELKITLEQIEYSSYDRDQDYNSSIIDKPKRIVRFCSKCGFELEENSNFCSDCGAPVIRD
jgi:hypothetical protein